MGLELLDRSLRTTGILLLIFLPFGVYYMSFFSALAIFTGAIWGMLNLIFISAMVRSIVRQGEILKSRAIVLGLFKFPVLYLSGYFLLKIVQFNPAHLVIGFSSIFIVIFLRSLGRLMVNSGIFDEEPINENSVRSSH